MQGVIQKVKINEQYFSAGVEFEVVSEKTVKIFVIALLCLLLVNALIVYFFVSGKTNVPVQPYFHLR